MSMPTNGYASLDEGSDAERVSMQLQQTSGRTFQTYRATIHYMSAKCLIIKSCGITPKNLKILT